MGSVISSEADVLELATENALLRRLATTGPGQQPMNSNDPQWNKLFSFNFNLDQRSRLAQAHFLDHMSPLLELLMHNTRETGNLAALVRVFHRRCSELEASAKCENKIFIWQAANALLILRFIAVFLAQRLAPSEFAKIFAHPGRPKARSEAQQAVNNGEHPDSLAQQLAQADGHHIADDDDDIVNDDEEDGDEGEKHNQIKPGSVAEQLLADLVNILTRIPVSQNTLQLHAEAIRVLLALLSTQLYEDSVNERSEFLRLLMLKFRAQSGELVRVLLENFLQHHSEPLDADCTSTKGGSGAQQGGRSESSLVVSLWSTLQSALTFGASMDEVESDQFPAQSLASLSLALLLSLVYYPAFGGLQNPYKHMLSIFQNAQEVSSLANLEASFKLDFTQLYNRLCLTVHKQRQPLLLLYMLIHNNSDFRNFLLSRVNLDQLVLPVIRVLYDGMCSTNSAPSSPSQRRHNSLSSSSANKQNCLVSSSATIHTHPTHQIYLALIVLLMLSEDDFFKKVIHEMTVKNIDWYQPDRVPLSEISLGGLLILVFAKTIQINTIRVRDRYFHMNSLATLANLSSCFKQISPLVSQKLIGLLETMTRRHTKMIRILRENAERGAGAEAQTGKTNTTNATAQANDDVEDLQEVNDDLHRDITALEEGIRTVLEIINACLCHNLRHNPDLVYTILYKRELFEHYHQHPMFQDLVWNIYAVINHFTTSVEALLLKANNGNGGGGNGQSTPTTTTPPTLTSFAGGPPSLSNSSANASVAELLAAIKKTAMEWPTDRLKKFPDLRFKYVEDDNTADFFIPYIWRLVHEEAGIYFDPQAIQLFRGTVDDD